MDDILDVPPEETTTIPRSYKPKTDPPPDDALDLGPIGIDTPQASPAPTTAQPSRCTLPACLALADDDGEQKVDETASAVEDTAAVSDTPPVPTAGPSNDNDPEFPGLLLDFPVRRATVVPRRVSAAPQRPGLSHASAFRSSAESKPRGPVPACDRFSNVRPEFDDDAFETEGDREDPAELAADVDFGVCSETELIEESEPPSTAAEDSAQSLQEPSKPAELADESPSPTAMADGTTPPPFDTSGSAALMKLLWRNGHAINGTSVPTWMISVTGSEARAVVLATVLRWFNPSVGGKKSSLPRASGGSFRTSARDMALRTMMPPATANRAMKYLVTDELLIADSGPAGRHKGIALQPNGEALALAISKQKSIPKAIAAARWEFLRPEALRPTWTQSNTRTWAVIKAPAVTIHNSILAVVQGDYLRARLLCQLLWLFDDGSGRCRAKVSDNGYFWWGMSCVRWAKMLGVSERSVRYAIQRLCEDELVYRMKLSYVAQDHYQGNDVTHLRPNFPLLTAKVQEIHALKES